MKYIKTILILLLLVGLPIGSWYFLKSGLDWRKTKVTDLKTKDQFFTAFEFTNSDKDKLYELMAHRTCIVKMNEGINADDESIINQYSNAYTFQFISFDKTVKDNNKWTSKTAVRYYKPENAKPRFNRIADVDYVLVDTSGYVRQYYEGSSQQVLKTLVEDVAVILPRKKEKDIKLKSN